MKMILLALLAISTAHAAETMVFEVPTSAWATGKSTAEFSINKAEGRAWISLLTPEGIGPQTGNRVNEERVKVPGLSFDSTSKMIVWDKDGAITECAKVVTRGVSVFRYDDIIPTGCKLKVKQVIKAVDDGFYTRNVEMTQVLVITE